MIGQTISHYEILEKLGEGGMGVVYQAKDTKLNRTVALKFLPRNVALSEDDRKRFILEAQAASALDHSNICTIYEINETPDGNLYIVMPAYEGIPLDKRIEQGPLPIAEAIDIAIQIADGLQAAHEKGVVHRDIKCSNIFITKKGQVKIMDFGLARSVGMTQVTKTGTTLGTVPYMSPEQARGETVDQRTDIWALGVVLYEMISGRLPFQSEYSEAIVYSILNEDPEPLTGLRSNVPMEVERIVRKAMQKGMRDRYQRIDEMVTDLSVLKRDTVVGTVKIPAQKSKKFNRNIAIVPIVLLLMAGILYFLPLREKPGEIITTQRQVTYLGDAAYAEISPDGKMVAYGILNESDNIDLYVQDISGGRPIKIYSGSIGALRVRIRWSPDGNELLIQSGGETYVVPKFGGSPRQISVSGYASWSPDGLYLAEISYAWKDILRTDILTGESIRIPLEGDFLWVWDVDWSPEGEYLLFLTSDDPVYTLWSISQDGEVQNKIIESDKRISSPRWSGDGDAIYYILHDDFHQSLMRINISARTGQARGTEQLIERDIGSQISIARDVNLIAHTRYSQHTNMWLLEYELKEGVSEFNEIELTSGTRSFIDLPKFSPDGTMIAFTWGREGDNNLYVIPVDGGEPQQLTYFSGVHCWSPVWSPDGNQIAFFSDRSGLPEVWIIPKSGGAARPFPNSTPHIFGYLSWSPGEKILYQLPGNRNINILDPNTGEEEPLVEDDTVGWILYPQFSPHSSYVAVMWNRISRGHGLWIISFEESYKKEITAGLIWPIKWSVDGLNILAFDQDQHKMVSISVDDGNKEILFELPSRDQAGRSYQWTSADVTPDGKLIAVPKITSISDIWVMEISE